VELTIEKLVYGGDGLARIDSPDSGRKQAIFVPFVLEGERVEAALASAQAGFSRATLQSVLSPSSLRVPAPCPYFGRCGGCHYQHTSYEHQLETKAAILRETLQRIGKLQLECELRVHASEPWNYRNRTRMRLHSHPEFAIGYFRAGSHALLPVETCPISSLLINRAVAALWQVGRAGNVPAAFREVEFFASADDATLQMTLYSAQVAPETASVRDFEQTFRSLVPETGTIALAAATAAKDPAAAVESVTLGSAAPLVYRTESANYRVSPGAFFQVNRYLVDKLVGLVVGDRRGGTAVDLYAGVGLFAVSLAQRFERVLAVESSPISFADLQYNVPANVKPLGVAVEQFVRNRAGSLRPDSVVVDPPRGGLGERLVRGIAELGPRRLTYVSCDPATLARDLAVLLGVGFRIAEAHLLDLFPQTFHVESVIHLGR